MKECFVGQPVQTAIYGSAVSIAILDERGRVVSANRVWQVFAETEPPAPLPCPRGMNYLEACALGGDNASSANLAMQGIQAVLAGDHNEFTLDFLDPSVMMDRWFSMRVQRIPDGHNGIAAVSVEDATDRKRAEEAQQHRIAVLTQSAHQAEQENAELNQLAYRISHDLRAPLRGIASLSHWIEEDIEGDVSATVREHLDMMRGRVQRMEAMINGLLQYSRLDRAQAAPEPVNVDNLLAAVLDHLEVPPSFMVEVGPGMPVITTERLRLEQVFLHLVGNALRHHHSPAQGRVRVEAHDLGDFYEFTVADDGPGIAPEYHDTIFLVFQTLQARDKSENTGMGLPIVKKIIQTQGGVIKLESDLGQGACFRFTWPKTPQRNPSAENVC